MYAPVTTSPRRKGSPLSTGSPPTDAGSQNLEKSIGARLSIAHAEAHKHAEVSRRRGQEIQQMQAGLEALLLQIDVLREAHEGVTASHTKLEGKLRLEEERARKLSRQLNKQREAVNRAADQVERRTGRRRHYAIRWTTIGLACSWRSSRAGRTGKSTTGWWWSCGA